MSAWLIYPGPWTAPRTWSIKQRAKERDSSSNSSYQRGPKRFISPLEDIFSTSDNGGFLRQRIESHEEEDDFNSFWKPARTTSGFPRPRCLQSIRDEQPNQA